MLRKSLLSVAGAGLILAPGVALARPPADAMSFSDIAAKIEQRPDFAYFDDVEWDDDGHYDVDYVTKEGGEVSIEIDPRTGEPRKR
jgi:hypothetical protein